MSRCAIFIDGGYLSKVTDQYRGSRNIDFAKLSRKLAGSDDILRSYYYNCMPYKGRTPRKEDVERYEKMQRFVDGIEALDNYEARMGILVYRGFDSQKRKHIYQQKRVDILLACDLVQLSTKNRLDKAIVISADSDFCPAIQIAKNEGVEVTLVYDTKLLPSKPYIEIGDKRVVVDSAYFGDLYK